MELEVQDNDVYGLVGKLCESIFRRKHSVVHQDEHQSYLSREEDDGKQLRRLKVKAYEILLNKSPQDYGYDDTERDPIVELLKHVFVLNTEAGCFSQAVELQKYLDEFIDQGLEQDSTIYSILQFLNCLKSIKNDSDDDSLDVFHYDKPHPSLPEVYSEYQIYPAEAFHLPQSFQNLLNQEKNGFVKYNSVEPGSQLTLLGRFTSPINSKSIRSNDIINLNVAHRTTYLPRGMNLKFGSYFLPQIKDIETPEDYLQPCIEGIVTEPESPWQVIDPLESLIKSNQANNTEICEIEENETEERLVNIGKIWEQMDKTSPLTNHATWETLGLSEPPKEPPFASESVEATIHLNNVAQDILLNPSTLNSPIINVSSTKFIKDIELLLLGVETTTFMYNYARGFELRNGIVTNGMCSETLQNLCGEVTRWGTCFKNLSDLIVIDPQTGKLQIEGLIFKALCSSIKEFLLFYHSAVLKVSIAEIKNKGLLNFLNKIRPLGNLILKVAQLCRCDSQRVTSLDEGIGILTHIYKEVTKVTEQNVALVFYSILKECCEVYFRLLQRWIFEGICADIYDEFMITARPKYVRNRGYHFWTKAFSINKKSVPGFLSDLTDSILQCGKAVMLLKICDPKNPLCRLSSSSQSEIRVCLSMGMLRDQIKFYEEYTIRGELEQEKEVSMCTAIQQQKEAEKNRAELVIAAQRDTLHRLKKEREDSLKKVRKEKIELLEQLKIQAQEVTERKEKERDAELLADKLLLEQIKKHEEEAIKLEEAERLKTAKYYSELAEEVEKREIRAKWRTKRMELFDERMEVIHNMKREFEGTSDTDEFLDTREKEPVKVHEKYTSDINAEKHESTDTESVVITVSTVNENAESSNRDENYNPTSAKVDDSSLNNQNANFEKDDNQNIRPLDDENQNCVSMQEQQRQSNDSERPATTKAVRPTVLDITKVNTQRYGSDALDSLQNEKTKILDHSTLDLLRLGEIDNMTEAQRNKFKILQQAYGFTPNNNESSTILFALGNTENQSELTEIHHNRLRNTQHLTHLNWNDVNSKDTKEVVEHSSEEQTEIQRNRMRNMQHLSQLDWNNVDSKDTVKVAEHAPKDQTEIHQNRLRNTQHLTHLNWNDVDSKDTKEVVEHSSEEQTEIQRNRMRNTQHLTHLDWNDVDSKDTKEVVEHSSEEQTEIQRNRMRNTQHLTHLDWNDVDSKDTKEVVEHSSEEQTEIQRNRMRNTQHLTHLNWNDVDSKDTKEVVEHSSEEQTEIQRNRMRNTQHLTHLNWNDIVDSEGTKEDVEYVLKKQTEIERNRLRNTQHMTDFNYNNAQIKKETSNKQSLTESEVNRNRVMSPEDVSESLTKPPSETLTDWQRNRNRNMAHNVDRYDFDINRFPEPECQKETPMSTTTDHFTTSTHSSSMQVHSCENTPFSEYANNCDMMCARSSDGMSTDEVTSQLSHNSKFVQDTPSFPNFFGFGSLLNIPANENHHQQQQLTAADVEMIDTTSLQVYLEKSVLVPLRAQSRLVNNAIIKYFLTEHKILSHLQSLRSYFFLLNGEFAKTLTHSLFTRLYEISEPTELFNPSVLMNILEKAIVSSLSGTYANSELLSISVTEVPPYLQTSNPEILGCLSLNYKISWPLNIIFNDILMEQYSKVFKFLLMVGRVFWALQEDFQILKIARKASVSQNHHKLQLYRHSMMQFMNALHTYLTCSVLHASWSEFEHELENAKTLDDVYNTHVRYIRKILSRCMLNVRGEPMRTCLYNIFKIVLKFHNRIRSQNWTDESKPSFKPNYKEIERMYMAFCEQRHYLAHVAEKLANCGYQPHLMQFLHALNINHRYDLIAKK